MSKTHKTAPFWVQLNNPERTGISVEEVHDHRFGECDLPEFPGKDHINIRGYCMYSWNYNGKNAFCGCNMCTEHLWRKRQNKSFRRKSTEMLNPKYLDVNDYDDIDDFVILSKKY